MKKTTITFITVCLLLGLTLSHSAHGEDGNSKEPFHKCHHHEVMQASLNGIEVDTSGNVPGRILATLTSHKIRIKIDYSRKKFTFPFSKV